MPENNGASNPKIHPDNLTAEATRLATLAGMQASGQPWQDGAAGTDTATLLATPHPDLTTNPSITVDEEPSTPVTTKKKPTTKKN